MALVYDIFANVFNRKANKKLCDTVTALIRPTDEVLGCACGTGLLTGVIAPAIPCVRGRSRAQWPRRKSGMGKYGGMKAETLEENISLTEIAHRKMTSYVV